MVSVALRSGASAAAATAPRLPAVASALALTVSSFLLTLVILLGAWASLPRLAFGWEAATIVSSSMEPALQPGDVILMEDPGRGVPGEGDIITFRDQSGRLITHRVAEVLPDGAIRTKGDANASPDPAVVMPHRIEGRGRLVIPAAGIPTLWARQGQWHLVIGLAALVAFAAQAVGTDLRPTRLASLVSGTRRARRQRASAPSRLRVARDRTLVAGVSLVVVAAGLFGTGQEAVASFWGTTWNAASSFDAHSVPAPTNLSATGTCLQPGGTRVIDLAWDPVASATGYRVFRADASGGPYAEVGTSPTATYQDATVANGTTYFYVVRAVEDPWESGDSAEATATAPLGCGGGPGGGRP